MKSIDDAKKLFFDFSCNKFYMWHDGVINEYESYNITQDKEKAWRKEYIEYWSNKLNPHNLEALNKLANANAYEALPEIFKNAPHADSYERLFFAINIRSIVIGSSAVSDTDRDDAMKFARNLLESILNNPIEISAKNRKKAKESLKYLDASTPEEYVINYVTRLLSKNYYMHYNF